MSNAEVGILMLALFLGAVMLGFPIAFTLIILSIVFGYIGVGFSYRGYVIHTGALLGTTMAFNVWMRIWPSQRKIIAAIKAGQAPDAAVVALAGLRSRHNTFMSVPLLFLMVSNHYPTIYGGPGGWIYVIGFVVVGFLVVSFLFNRSASPSPARY